MGRDHFSLQLKRVLPDDRFIDDEAKRKAGNELALMLSESQMASV